MRKYHSEMLPSVSQASAFGHCAPAEGDAGIGPRGRGSTVVHQWQDFSVLA